MTPRVSVIVPMYNEAHNVAGTISALVRELEARSLSFEVLPIDDGSTDGTGENLAAIAHSDLRIRPYRHQRNTGRGRALRTGFAAARGRWVVTIDADLSYGPEHVTAIVNLLESDPDLDLVIGSPYMPGGRTERVPPMRLWASMLGNRLLGLTMARRFHTFTGILRGYRRAALQELDLISDGKEIHLEIIAQALALGWNVREMPAVLRSRRAGVSKFKWRQTTTTHLLYSVSERPLLFFGAVGALCVAGGTIIALALGVIWRRGVLNPERPLMTVMVVLVLAGAQLTALGWLGAQVSDLRRAQYRLQRSLRRLNDKLANEDWTHTRRGDGEPLPTPTPLANRAREGSQTIS